MARFQHVSVAARCAAVCGARAVSSCG